MNINTLGKGKKWKVYVPPENDFGNYALSEVGTTLEDEVACQHSIFPGTLVLFRVFQYSRDDINKAIRGMAEKIQLGDDIDNRKMVYWIGPIYDKIRHMITSVHWSTQMLPTSIITEEEEYAYARQYFVQCIFWTPASFGILDRKKEEGEYLRFREWFDLPVEFVKRNSSVCKLSLNSKVPGFKHNLEFLLSCYLKIKTEDYLELEYLK